jgi:hypothetical protein
MEEGREKVEREERKRSCEEGTIKTREGGEMRVHEEEVSALSTTHIT